MASRRSRLKVLPNLGGRINREGNANAETISKAATPKATTNGDVEKSSVKSTPDVADCSNTSVVSTSSRRDGSRLTVDTERSSECKSSELNSEDEVQIINSIAKESKIPVNCKSTRTQKNEEKQLHSQSNSGEDAGHIETSASKTNDCTTQDDNSAKQINTNSITLVSNESKPSSEVKGICVESSNAPVVESPEVKLPESPLSKDVPIEQTKKSPVRCAPRRFLKAKPNLLEAGRRNTLKNTPNNKEVEESIRIPPVVHRIASIQERISEKVPETKAKKPNVLCSKEDSVENERTSLDIENVASSVEITSSDPKSSNKGNRIQSSSASFGHSNRSRTQSKNYEKEEVLSRRNIIKNKKSPPDRSKMTMFDLIYWNPTNNPMVYNDEAEAVQPVTEDKDQSEEVNILAPTEEEERVDNGEDEQEEENHDGEAMPGPRVKIGPDGNIILDEQSLVIETTASKNNNVTDTPIVYEKSSNTTYSSFRNKRRHKNWSDKETMKFYKALSTVGTDFSLMANLFPKRTRDELKLKFKKEERSSKDLVDRAVRERQQFDLSIFDDDDDEEEEENTPTDKQITKKILNTRRKRPKLSDENSNNRENNPLKKISSDISTNPQLIKRRSKKRKAAFEDGSDSDKRSDTSCSKESRCTYDALIFDIDNPVKSSRKLNNKDSPNNKKGEPSPESKNSKTKENEDLIELSGSDSHDSEIEVLSNIRRPTRSGRQPKQRSIFTIEEKAKRQRRRPQISSSPVVPTVAVTSTPADLNTTSPSIVASQLHNILLSHPALSNLASSTDSSQNRLIFVPSPSSDQGTQVINVYMLSPASSSRSSTTPFTPSQQLLNQSLVRQSPLVRASPEFTSPQIQLSTHGRVIQTVRTPTRIFVPNLAAAANRPSQQRSPATATPTTSSPCLHKLLSTPPSTSLQKQVIASQCLTQGNTVSPNTDAEISASASEAPSNQIESPTEVQNTAVVVQAINTNNNTVNTYSTLSPSSTEYSQTVQVVQVRNTSPQNTKYLIILPQKSNQETSNVIKPVLATDNNTASSVISETGGSVIKSTNLETLTATSETTQKNTDAVQVLQV